MTEVSEEVAIVDPKKELVNFMRSGIIDFPNAKLVKAYHGIVKRGLFEKIKERTGKFCGGLSPDIYLSVALSTIVNRLVCIDVPISIFGACRASTTADSVNKINMGKLEDAPHLLDKHMSGLRSYQSIIVAVISGRIRPYMPLVRWEERIFVKNFLWKNFQVIL